MCVVKKENKTERSSEKIDTSIWLGKRKSWERVMRPWDSLPIPIPESLYLYIECIKYLMNSIRVLYG